MKNTQSFSWFWALKLTKSQIYDERVKTTIESMLTMKEIFDYNEYVKALIPKRLKTSNNLTIDGTFLKVNF